MSAYNIDPIHGGDDEHNVIQGVRTLKGSNNILFQSMADRVLPYN